MKIDEANPMSVIAGAGMGWKSICEAKTFGHGKPCNTCGHFEMRMIRANESDSFGHLLPYCAHPNLRGEGGCQTQMTSTCNKWRSKARAEAGQ